MADYIFPPEDSAAADAEYVVLELDPDLPNAKELIAGTGINIVVGADTVTISGDGSSAQTYITANDETATLPNSFQIVEGSNVTLDYVGNQLIISASVSGSGGGTVTIVNSGNANPLFSTNVTTATTTPTIAYTLLSAASGTFWCGPASGTSATPTYRGILGTDLAGALAAGTGITIVPAQAPGSRLTINAYGFQPVSSTLNALSTSLAGTGYITQIGPDSFVERTFQDSTNITWTNPAGIAGNSSANVTSNVYTKNSSSLLNYFATSAPNVGEVPLGTTDGHFINTKPNAGAGVQLDFGNGVFTISATGATGNSGTVTSVSALPPGAIFNTSVANPTTTPTISFNITSSTLQDLATSSGNGIMVSTDGVHHAFRSIQGTTGEINVTNPAGLAGDPTLSLDSSVYTDRDSSVLNALATGLTGTGFVSQNGAQFYDRTLQGTTNRITIGNPTGAAGDPTFDVGTDVLVVGDVTALPGIQVVNGSGIIQIGASGALGGTVTDITVGDISPLWDTNVSTSTTTPSVTYTLNAIASGASLLGPKDGVDDEPTLRRLLGQDLTDALVEGSNVTITLVGDQLEISATGSGSGYDTVEEEGIPLTQRSTINFVGAGITASDDSGGAKTQVSLDATLNALASFSATGIMVSQGSDTFVGREIAGTPNQVTVANGNGIAGNITVGLDSGINANLIADGSVSSTEFQYINSLVSNAQDQLNNKQPLSSVLNALASSLVGTGYVIQTGPDAFVERSLATANSNHVTITNPSGIAGASTFDIGANVYTNETHSLLNYLASSAPNLGEIPMGTTDNHYLLTKPNAGTGIQMDFANGVFTVSATGAQGGTIVSAGDLAPLFTTSESAGNISFTQSVAASGTYFGVPKDGASDEPSFLTLVPGAFSDNYVNLGLFIDGASAVLSSGEVGVVPVDFNGLVVGWTVTSLQSATITMNVYKSSYSNYPAMTSMVGAGTKPATSSAFKNKGTTADWGTTTISNGDLLKFILEGNNSSEGIGIALKILRTS